MGSGILLLLSSMAAALEAMRSGSSPLLVKDVEYCLVPIANVEALATHFENIHEAADAYYESERYRRYGVVSRTEEGWSLVRAGRFVQSSAYNKYLGDKIRAYAPLRAQDVASPEFQALLDRFAASVAHATPEVHVHQIRVCCDASSTNLVPEGVHQDGYDSVAIACIDRHAVQGAVTSLRKARDADPHFVFELPPGNMIVFDDRRLWHDVSPMLAAPGATKGYRDIYALLAHDSEG
ncbi:hypothetical protein CTAYLR_002403 [Chrysophaeum taylorii]|uniref:2OG-Fe dioxygenase family protein n=1 Tax=Chrysophaeum taylorii TaxID=2483200 RepID=A0AAD7XQN5_9STRA|nr:hypothetical protein CTAYLR_002403 [Chrysophaeum taylorii]